LLQVRGRLLEMPDRSSWEWLVDAALAEDLGPGDATSAALIEPSRTGQARIEAREPVVVAGLEVVRLVFERTGAELQPLVADGASLDASATLARVSGAARAILAGERVALNFLQRLSGIATLTDRFCRAVDKSGVRISDTRKTTPGWRTLEKFAVRCGGGTNHRIGLFDGILIKDNHIAAVGSVRESVERARAAGPPGLRVEVEVESLDGARDALDAGAEALLIDNQSPAVVERIVKLVGGRVPVEASGGIRLDTVAEMARTGVDWISVGAITHSAPAVDLGLEWNGSSKT
jgi:nicotinate-nucleotide pyrophosphorylase (carboxylating)